ncbi:MAG: two-component response regulator [Bacteroidota bacterium]|jgi:CheY-like chemotaxis protein|nr:two-component response regulator [Bacteroidota bacterium]
MKTILLIEDDYLDVESVKRALKKAQVPHVLHVSHNGADALNSLTTNENKIVPDIILLDINLPKMSGLEFLEIVKSYFSLQQIKIYIITTSSEEYDKMSAQHFDIAGYIVKPLDFNRKSNPDVEKLLKDLTE